MGDILEHSASSEEDVGGLSESKQGGNYQGLPTAVAVQASETTALARNNRIEGDSLPQVGRRAMNDAICARYTAVESVRPRPHFRSRAPTRREACVDETS